MQYAKHARNTLRQAIVRRKAMRHVQHVALSADEPVEEIPETNRKYYGWVPSLTGWLSFRSATGYVFKGFRASCQYQDTGNGSCARFKAVAGKNLNDSPLVPDYNGRHKFIFSIDARRNARLEDVGVDGVGGGDSLRGYITVYVPGPFVFFKNRLRSLLGHSMISRGVSGGELARIFFVLDRTGGCILRCADHTQISDDSKNQIGWLIAQAFIVLKDFFHTHIAHHNATDSGVPLVDLDKKVTKAGASKDRIAMKVRRRLHRKYATLVQTGSPKARIYLAFLRVFASSVGGYKMDGTSNRLDQNPLLRADTYDNASNLLEIIETNKRDNKNENIAIYFSFVALIIALLGTYFQIIGSVSDNPEHLNIPRLLKDAAMANPNALYALFFSGLFIVSLAFVMKPRSGRVLNYLDEKLQYFFGTYVFENVQNLAITIMGKCRVSIALLLTMVAFMFFMLRYSNV